MSETVINKNIEYLLAVIAKLLYVSNTAGQ